MPARTIVLYDNGCNLCSREIAHYRKLDRDNRVEWVDITTDQHFLDEFGISYEQAMRRMHIVGADGRIRDGAGAFVELWSVLPYYRLLASLIHKTRSVALLEALYTRFADWRYRRRTTTVCNTAPGAPFIRSECRRRN